jgi:hypothetical protein
MNVRGWKVRNLLAHRLRGWKAELFTWLGIGCVAELTLTVIRANGTVEALGVASRRVVTNDGVAFIVDAFQNLVELEAMNAHGIGTNATAEAAGDTALGAEVETRVSGTQSEPASNQYRTTGTITATATRAVTEHGLFNSTTVSGSKLFDRSVFSTVNLAIGDSIQCQYTLTLTAGG